MDCLENERCAQIYFSASGGDICAPKMVLMTPDIVQAHFTGIDDNYRFARWRRAIVPVVFGVDDATLTVVKGAIQAVVKLAGHHISDPDPEMGANLMVFFLADWDELSEVPDLQGLVPELPALLGRLKSKDANQYRLFRFESDGSIRAVFVFLRMQGALAEMDAADLALAQAVQIVLAWGQGAFSERSPLATVDSKGVIRPEIASLIRAAYDPILPVAAADPSHALRLFARLGAQ